MKGFRIFIADMPPRAVKKPAGTPTPKKAAVKTPSKTPKSANKTPPPKPEPEIVENVEKPEEVENVEKPEEVAPVEDVKVLEVLIKEEKKYRSWKFERAVHQRCRCCREASPCE